jgi:hypothetical protein
MTARILLIEKPISYVHVTKALAQSVTAGAHTKVLLDTLVKNNDDSIFLFDAVVNNRITLLRDGLYVVIWNVQMTSTAGGFNTISVWKNGVFGGQILDSGIGAGASSSLLWCLESEYVSGDYLEFFVFGSSGGSVAKLFDMPQAKVIFRGGVKR